jgi:hypothetical protein
MTSTRLPLYLETTVEPAAGRRSRAFVATVIAGIALALGTLVTIAIVITALTLP